MVLIRHIQGDAIREWLRVLERDRPVDLPIRTYRKHIRHLREQVLALKPWVAPDTRTILISIARGHEHFDQLVRGLERMPLVRPVPRKRISPIQPAHVVEGAQILMQLVPESSAWKQVEKLAAIGAWYGLLNPERLQLTYREGSFADQVFALDTDGSVRSFLGQPEGKKSYAIHARDIAHAVWAIRREHPDAERSSFAARRKLVYDRLTVLRTSFSKILERERKILKQRYPDVYTFLGMHSPHINSQMPPDELIRRAEEAMNRPELAIASYTAKLAAIGEGWYDSPAGSIAHLIDDPAYRTVIEKHNPRILVWIGVPRELVADQSKATNRIAATPKLEVAAFVAAVEELLDDPMILAGNRARIFAHVGEGVYSDGALSVYRRYRSETFRNEVERLSRTVRAFVDGDDMPPEEAIRRVRGLMHDRDLRDASFTAKARAIGRGWHHDSMPVMTRLLKRYAYREEMRLLDDAADAWVGTTNGRPHRSGTMPEHVFLERAREAMRIPPQELLRRAHVRMGVPRQELSLRQKVIFINDGWYDNYTVLNNRVSHPRFIEWLLSVDRDVAYWLYPLQAEIINLHVRWRDEAGGRLVDPHLTPRETFERIRDGRRVVTQRSYTMTFTSDIWGIEGEEAIDLMSLNRSINAFKGTRRLLALFRNVKIAHHGKPIGIRHIRYLPRMLGVAPEEITGALRHFANRSVEETWGDMRDIAPIYEQLMGDYGRWYDVCFGTMPEFGDHENVLREGLLKAANVLVTQEIAPTQVDADGIVARTLRDHIRREQRIMWNEFPLSHHSPEKLQWISSVRLSTRGVR